MVESGHYWLWSTWDVASAEFGLASPLLRPAIGQYLLYRIFGSRPGLILSLV